MQSKYSADVEMPLALVFAFVTRKVFRRADLSAPVNKWQAAG
jgi:hypothetical protein